MICSTVTIAGSVVAPFASSGDEDGCAQGSVRLWPGMNLIVSGLNLNNKVFGFYQGSPQYMIQREYYQPMFSAGIRWSPAPGER